MGTMACHNAQKFGCDLMLRNGYVISKLSGQGGGYSAPVWSSTVSGICMRKGTVSQCLISKALCSYSEYTHFLWW